MLEKFFSSIGFEGVEVKTVIHQKVFSPGDTINGTLHIQGGQSDQQIKGIKLILFAAHSEEVREDSDFSYYDEELSRADMKEKMMIYANEEKELPFQMTLAEHHPKTSDTIKTYIETKVLVHNGVDPTDKDFIIIK
ncbi:sporulation protein [Jeotgalibacillus proteolyticus]|uniref:Stage 0 sporulation protein M n=1 Tax=Jeotgalibacillus proteolyticus TaxID=2082395 RepID=A0A2S5GG15_9BACL|nr:sporulation protein [Jeotgalibacillus proteolyticus]PPA71864.1 hypothetical protein C4B60_00345 [Jeotgalibacillus proteolyticus]